EPRGLGWVRVYNHSEVGLAALGVADLDTALDHLGEAWTMGTGEGAGSPNAVPMAGDLAEALARRGRSEECGKVIEWLEGRVDATGLTYPQVAAFRARGLLSTDAAQAERWLQASLCAPG